MNTQIYSLLPKKYRAFFLIESSITANHLPEVQNSYRAFAEAVEIIFETVPPNKTIAVIFGGRELSMDINQLKLTYQLIPPALHATLNHNFIHLDLVSSINHCYEVQVACYLEELVHAFMNTHNEENTHKIVELLYPKVYFDGTTFQLKDSHEKQAQ